ncbi:C-terminal binding protein [Acuticoccus mangrovi]|uniref:C-terminal binding protein n=1 Tax=Acuticoccus mangrovi TaxID=2796142 RepID=A0A934IQQ8_9HYPH|nr:C-terminal binding protein [Acuticoccus mangrovi]MBJ3776945.1 C-terminal binding protein [Acuticoccus mangrovi]
MRILIVEPQFADPDMERAILGPEAEIVLYSAIRDGPVPRAELAACDGLIHYRSRNAITRADVEAMERCRIVAQAGVGFNHIDLVACAERGIPVCNTPDYGTTEVADHTVALALSLVRGVAAYNDRLRRRAIGWDAMAVPNIRRLRGATFGVVGLGRIGLAAALRMKGFECEIAFHDPYLAPGAERALGFRRTETLAELMATSDILSVNTPLNAETAGLIGPASLAAAKPGLILVNTARGGTIDLDALEAALRSGQVAAAGLDVLPREPLDYAHPLLAAWERGETWLDGRLIVTPHAAFYSPDSITDMRRIVTETAANYLTRGVLRACVNAALLAEPRPASLSAA